MDVADAEHMARRLLEQLPRRLSHVGSVAELAGSVADDFGMTAYPMVSAAWLHDIGYTPEAASTGFHALDGARFLRKEGASASVVNLVAHHSHAALEAELRGLRTPLETEFPYDPELPHELLCYCDMTTGPSGERVSVEERLREIRERYGPDDLVTEFIGRAQKEIVETVERVERSLARAAQSK